MKKKDNEIRVNKATNAGGRCVWVDCEWRDLWPFLLHVLSGASSNVSKKCYDFGVELL